MSIIFAGLKDSSKDSSESDSENFQRTTTFPEAVIENKKSSTKSKEDNLSSLSKNDISDNELYIAESPSCNYNAIILLFCYNINFFYINFSYTIFIYSPSIKNPKTH